MTLFRLKPIAIQLDEGTLSPKEVQILRCGTFHHPQYGTFNITPMILASMKKNFDAKVRGVDLAIDYGHESDRNAAGWIDDLVLKENDTQLWAKVRWTPKGSDIVMGMEYRYLSADFTFDYQDGETLQKFGPTLFGAGLTNRPVVKGMAPVELSEGDLKMDEKDKIIADLQAQIAALKQQMDAGKADMECMGEMKKKLADYEAADAKAKEDALAKQKADEEAAAAAAVATKLAEKEASFVKLLSEGKAIAAQKEAFMADDMPKFIELAQPLNLSEKGHGNDSTAPVAGEGTAGEQLLKLAEKLVASQKIGMTEAIGKVRAENPELVARYKAESQSK